jgi:hypothetical protein
MNNVETGTLVTRPAMRSIESAYAAGVVHPGVAAAMGAFDPQFGDIPTVNFLTRTAPMGAVSAAVVEATFYNPNPETIRAVFPRAWDIASPQAYLDAQSEVFAPALEHATASMAGSELAELAELSRTVAVTASGDVQGKPLFAGLARLPWPSGDHLVVWHAAKLLREHRGDGHVAALTVEGLSGIDALVIHAAFDGIPPDALRLSRRWEMDAWQAAIASLRGRGWLTGDEEPTLTTEGSDRRTWIEDRTNELAAMAYAPIGEEGVARMTDLGQTMTRALGDADMLPAHYVLPPKQ